MKPIKIYITALCAILVAFNASCQVKPKRIEKTEPGKILMAGADGRYAHTDPSQVNLPEGVLTVHAPEGEVAPDIPGAPTTDEIAAWNEAKAEPYRNAYLYHNKRDDPSVNAVYLFFVDSEGKYSLVETPGLALNIRRRTVPSPVFANAGDPKEEEVLAYINGLPANLAPLPATIMVQGEGAIPMHQSFDRPASAWFWDGQGLTKVTDFPRKVEVPPGAFADPDAPEVTEIYTWLAPDTTFLGNHWHLYLVGNGTVEDPDWAWQVAADHDVAVSDIFCVKKPATVTGGTDGDGMFDNDNEGSAWQVQNVTITDPTAFELPDNTVDAISFGEYLKISTTDDDEEVEIGKPGTGILKNVSTQFWNNGSWRQVVVNFAINVSYDVQAYDAVLDISTNLGDGTVNLPGTPATGRTLFVIKRTPDNVLTIDGNGRQVNGSPTVSLEGGHDAFVLIFNGAQWSAMRMPWAQSTGGTSIVKYQAGDAFVWATGTGVSFTKNGTTGEWAFGIPAGVELLKATVSFMSSDCDNANSNRAYILFDFEGDRGHNSSLADMDAPFICVNTTGTPNRNTPLNFSTGGIGTGNTQYGVSAIGGGDGSDLELTVTEAPQGLDNIMQINFSTQ